MKKKSVLFVISNMKDQGSGRFLMQMLEWADYEKYSINVLSLSGDFHSDNENIKIRKITENSYLDLPFFKGFAKCVKDRKWSYLPLLVTEKFILRKPSIKGRIAKAELDGKFRACICLDMESCAYAAKNIWAKNKIQRFPYSVVGEPYEEDFKAMAKMDYAVCMTEKAARDFAETYKFDIEKIHVIPNVPDIKLIQEKSEEYTVDHDRKYVFTSVCRLASVSQLDFALEVCANLIKNDFRNFVWHIVSGTEDTVSARMKIKKQNLDRYIDFTEKKSNPYPYIKACDLYIHISDIDGEIISIIAANALNKRVLALKTELSQKLLDLRSKGVVCGNDAEKFARTITDMVDVQLMHADIPVCEKEMYDSYMRIFDYEKENTSSD